jgi:hypothetical protein
MARATTGRLLQFGMASKQGGDLSALPAAPPAFVANRSPGYAEGNRLRALSWLAHTLAQLVDKRGAGPVAAVDAAIAEGNHILQSLALLHLPSGDSAAECAEATRAIREIQQRIARWRERILD